LIDSQEMQREKRKCGRTRKSDRTRGLKGVSKKRNKKRVIETYFLSSFPALADPNDALVDPPLLRMSS
jgi:hypothetical protein